MNESIKQQLHELELKDLKIQELEGERERIGICKGNNT